MNNNWKVCLNEKEEYILKGVSIKKKLKILKVLNFFKSINDILNLLKNWDNKRDNNTVNGSDKEILKKFFGKH